MENYTEQLFALIKSGAGADDFSALYLATFDKAPSDELIKAYLVRAGLALEEPEYESSYEEDTSYSY